MRLSALDPDGVNSLDQYIDQSLREYGCPVSESLVVVAHKPFFVSGSIKIVYRRPAF